MLVKRFISIYFFLLFSAGISHAQKKSINSFFFETDLSILNLQQQQVFEQFSSEIDTGEVLSVTISGYCDDRGRKGYNDTLSNKRAIYIKSLLKEKGINPSKIIMVVGKGKVDLDNNQNVQEQRMHNRRVDVELSYLKKKFTTDNSILSDTLKVGDKIVLENILFENSKSILLEESIPVLEKITEVIKQKTQYGIAVLGHICCNPPGIDVKDFVTGENNLSEARAKIIYDYLIYRGVNPKRLSYKGMMANHPLGKGEKYDRRVELQITSINFTDQ